MDVTAIFFVGLALVIGILYIGIKKRRKLPPGPIGLPFLGYYPFLRKDPVKTLCKLGKTYGNVFGLYVGPQYLVVLDDWEAMTEAYKQAPTLQRPPSLFTAVPYNFGVVGISGPEWVLVRRLMSRAMKDIGLQRTRWEELVQEEVSEVLERITKYGTGPIDVRDFLEDTFANNIMTLVLGRRLQSGHALTKLVARSVDDILELTPTLGMMNFSPRLLKILQVLGVEKELNIAETVRDFTNFISDAVDEKMKNPDKEMGDSFIDVFSHELQNQTKQSRDDIERTVKGNVIALLTGGSETSRTTIIFALIAMAEHPEKQKKVQEELDRVVGRDGSVQWADRRKIPYTYAALLETLRWRTIQPLSTLRMPLEDIEVQGYHIPKGTFITYNIWTLHNDPKYWDAPEKFIPERFLSEDGKSVNTDAKSFTPFSYGKRMCPGKLIANMENIQYFAALMQKFTVVPFNGEKVKYNSVLGLTWPAHNVKLCFHPRQ